MGLSDLKPDPAELVLLAVLADASMYGYAISKEVAARSRGEIKLSPGVLYPLLALLEKQGLIVATWDEVKSDRHAETDEPAEESRGRRRKWYKLSAKGRKRLAQRVEAHRAYQQMIESFLTTDPTRNTTT